MKRQRDRETEGKRDGEMERIIVSLSFRLSFSPSLFPSVSVAGRRKL
jgi:hypothetical protein